MTFTFNPFLVFQGILGGGPRESVFFVAVRRMVSDSNGNFLPNSRPKLDQVLPDMATSVQEPAVRMTTMTLKARGNMAPQFRSIQP